MHNADRNNDSARLTEGAIQRMGLTSFKPFASGTLTLPEAPTREEVTNRIYEAAQAGKDPSEDKGIVKMLTQLEVSMFNNHMRTRFDHDESVRRVCNIKDQGPALMEEMGLKFAEAVETLQEAHPILGNEDLTDETGYFPAHDKNWPTRLAARVALHTTQAIIEGWSYLITATQGPSSINGNQLYYIYAVPTLDDYDKWGNHLGDRQSNGNKTSVWDMVEMGIETKLATSRDEVNQRRQAIDTEHERRKERRSNNV